MEEQIWLENFKEKDWDWDFKECYGSQNKNTNIAFFLMYKLFKLNENSHPLKFTKIFKFGNSSQNKYTGSKADCDKEAYPLYNSFGWQDKFEDSIRGETMNSFTTTFNRAIRLSDNRDSIYLKIGINGKVEYLRNRYDALLIDNNYKEFEIINNNIDEFEKFAKLTHSIGNFMVLPNWMNTGRGGNPTVFDYWDLTLKSFYEFLLPLDAWETFVNKYYLHPFLDNNLKPMEFWDNHFTSSALITKPYQFKQFLFRVNRSIEERGKYLKGKLNNKETSEWPKSAEELWNKENRLEN